MLRKTLTAATLALATLAAPVAMAGGSVSFEINPANADEANAIRLGLALYGIAQAANGSAHVSQHGTGNGAAIGQSGGGNYGVVHQEGNGHTGTLAQNGCDSYGIFQFGQNTNANVGQGNGCQTGMLIQYGW
ncbi:hypothetical protein [Nioella nitratireducens]|uniref:hypothetical protein n=1 Tax=Nioella nitratireducens TaxID=1287720 RepID=UPI0008FD6036|nr:hypothetical protein [Nioella nitratireducens]